jgi:starch synthase
MEPLKIWFASSEVDPFIKTGGLADVAGSLPIALAQMGIDVRVVLPKYGQIDKRFTSKMEFVGNTTVDLTWRRQYCGIYKIVQNGVTFYFIDNEFYFYREWYYGLGDDGERFAFFSKAILDILPIIDFKPDIIHLNDWQTGLVSVLLDSQYRDYRDNGFYKNMHTVFTIHNLRYQGVFSKEMMDTVLGINGNYFHSDGLESYGNLNFLKSGLAWSTRITTVSKTYSEEIKTEFFGEGLQGILIKRAAALSGIENGIDYKQNDPATDTRLYKNFTVDELSGKLENKRCLQKDLGLPIRDDAPLIGIISRMVDQKGFDLIERMLGEILDMDVQLVVLGTGDKKYEDMFIWAQHEYPTKISSNIRYDGTLAQRIYAACDMFLMPSLFEPCGLSQIFSMRYGTVPIVRETGGLKDTVVPYNELTNEGTGFSFANYNAHEMKDAIDRAIELYKNSALWEELVKRCMREDFSWDHAAKEYVALYQGILKEYPIIDAIPVVEEPKVEETEIEEPSVKEPE